MGIINLLYSLVHQTTDTNHSTLSGKCSSLPKVWQIEPLLTMDVWQSYIIGRHSFVSGHVFYNIKTSWKISISWRQLTETADVRHEPMKSVSENLGVILNDHLPLPQQKDNWMFVLMVLKKKSNNLLQNCLLNLAWLPIWHLGNISDATKQCCSIFHEAEDLIYCQLFCESGCQRFTLNSR